MNRKILFRGKRVDNGEWYFGDISQSPQNTITINPIDSSFMFQDRKEVLLKTVGEFTGLNDKNKKKIFEGDILKHIDNYGKIISVVKYEYNAFVFYGIQLKTNLNPKFASENSEIIGNIHDNPELLGM